jgi:hypothetical protein
MQCPGGRLDAETGVSGERLASPRFGTDVDLQVAVTGKITSFDPSQALEESGSPTGVVSDGGSSPLISTWRYQGCTSQSCEAINVAMSPPLNAGPAGARSARPRRPASDGVRPLYPALMTYASFSAMRCQLCQLPSNMPTARLSRQYTGLPSDHTI